MKLDVPASQVLVTVGTPCTMTGVGSTETLISHLRNRPDFIARAAFDAGLVDLSVDNQATVQATWLDGTAAGFDEIEQRHGKQLRSQLGIRVIPQMAAVNAQTDIGAELPHDLTAAGLRRQLGFSFDQIRDSPFKDMFGLFDDDPQLGPSRQSQLFAFGGLGALASLPTPLSKLIPQPGDFRVAAGLAVHGFESWNTIHSPDRPADDPARDKFAARLAASLGTHGPALVSTMLAPSFPLSRTRKNPELLDDLPGPDGRMRVPQTPLASMGACAASLIAFAEIAPQMLSTIPGFNRPTMVLWTAADAATAGWQALDAFGPVALTSTHKLNDLNAERTVENRRPVEEILAPFDIDASGTVIGDGGAGVMVTTLEFALKNMLDITSIIVGWGQSGETGGKAHFAGVGFGGENAIIQAYDLARAGHGYGVGDFEYLVAHATGTRTNSRTDLTAAARGREAAAQRAGVDVAALAPQKVGTPKALGDGHTMGATGLMATSHAIHYLLGEPAVALPTLRQIDPDLEDILPLFELQRDPWAGNQDGGAIVPTQGFGGYNGAVAFRAANVDSISRYQVDQSTLDAYLERWDDIRAQRQRDEAISRVTRGAALQLADQHRWH